jgi:predicted Zn-dependent protease
VLRAAAATGAADPMALDALGTAEEALGDVPAACAAYARAAALPGARWASMNAARSRARLRCP